MKLYQTDGYESAVLYVSGYHHDIGEKEKENIDEYATEHSP